MRTLATKQPSNQDFTHQKPVRATPKPIVRSLSTGLTGSAMLQRKPGCACGGGCPRCQQQALLQTKLKIGEPGDKYEQEADRVADEVMRMPDSSVQRQVELEEEEDDELLQTKPLVQRQVTGDGGGNETPPIVHEVLRSPGGAAASQQSTENTSLLVQRMCDECAEEEKGTLQRKPIQDSRFKIQNSPTPLRISGLNGPVAAQFHWPNQMARIQRQEMEDGEEETLQTKRTTSFTPDITPGIEVGIQSLKGSGQPLSLSERTFFEPRFGHDFSQVRVHTDALAASAARAVHARAYTLGSDVVFGARQYEPATNEGRRLLAHELTHVLQQKKTRNGHQRRLQRTVDTKTHCRKNRAGAPKDPLAELRESDKLAARVAADTATKIKVSISLDPDPIETPGTLPFAYAKRFGSPSVTEMIHSQAELGWKPRDVRRKRLSLEMKKLADRFSKLAKFLGGRIKYNCRAVNELAWIGGTILKCKTTFLAVVTPKAHYRTILICPKFWSLKHRGKQAIVLIHEAAHMQFGIEEHKVISDKECTLIRSTDHSQR